MFRWQEQFIPDLSELEKEVSAWFSFASFASLREIISRKARKRSKARAVVNIYFVYDPRYEVEAKLWEKSQK